MQGDRGAGTQRHPSMRPSAPAHADESSRVGTSRARVSRARGEALSGLLPGRRELTIVSEMTCDVRAPGQGRVRVGVRVRVRVRVRALGQG